MNANTWQPLGVVSDKYRLITNEEALDMAHKCCETFFPETNKAEWRPTKIDGPSTGRHCCVDLCHNSEALDFSFVPPNQRPDAFGPFVRVINSYNGLYLLSFFIGFYRKVCANGMIARTSEIEFKFIHRGKSVSGINFKNSVHKLKTLKKSFENFLGALKDCQAPLYHFPTLVNGALLLKAPADPEDIPLKNKWDKLQQNISDTSARYAEELGENAYAVFNVITDFASNPPESSAYFRRARHSWQRLAGSWVESFTSLCVEPSFSLDNYLVTLDKKLKVTEETNNPDPHLF
ncbi:MAG: DUF945 domain-containing protein [Deltaproteobacteria bacterium]|nr:DUF945 domain-containing protein [Deltaproteobacteria bacterium]